MSNLSPAERETVILFNDGEDTAIVETCARKWKNRMRALCSQNAECSLIFEDEHCERYLIPKKLVKIQKPRRLSEEQRQKLRERALNALQGGRENK